MRISVAMCTYNGQRYLNQQLDSILSQSRLPEEMVICDDASTDDTPRLLEAFAARAPFPVRLVRNGANLGSTPNFVQAMGLCQGDLIALCDQDDVWKPEKLAVLEHVLQQDVSASAAFSDGELINEQSHVQQGSLWNSVGYTAQVQAMVQQGLAMRVLQKMYFVTGATLMLRAEARQLFQGVSPDWVHDAWFCWHIAMRGKLVGVPQRLIQYRVHTGNQVGIDGNLLAQIRKKRTPAQVSLALQKERNQLEVLRDNIARNCRDEDEAARKTLEVVNARLLYVQQRASVVASSRIVRLVRLLFLWGQYASFGKGWRTMLSDLSV